MPGQSPDPASTALPSGEPEASSFDRFSRTISLRAGAAGVAARVRDNVHDFRVMLSHDGTRITAVTGAAVRFPWTTCPEGLDRLKTLIGMPLAALPPGAVDAGQHCTHMLDLAKLAIAQARRGGDRFYRVEIQTTDAGATTDATVDRDGVKVLAWRVAGDVVATPGPFAGHSTLGRAAWHPDVAEDADLLEAALIARRGLLIFRGRRRLGTRTRHAAALRYQPGACLTFQPDRIDAAVRPADFVDYESGTSTAFTQRPEW